MSSLLHLWSSRCARLEELGKGEPGLFTESFELGSQVSDVTTAAESAVALIQVWAVAHQQGWLATMRENVGVLTDKPGFQSMRTHASEDGKRVAVYSQRRDSASLED